MDAGELLVDHALSVGAFDARTRAAAATFLHDTLAVGAAGANAAFADTVLATAQGWGAGEGAGVLGRPGIALPPASAAFVNAFQIHGQEYDCVHEGAVLHPMATLTAALLAELACGPAVSGAELLAAVVAGVDVAVALGLAAQGPLSFFRPATAGIFGSVAGIARLRRLERAVALDAFGHALALAAGTMQAHAEGRPALPLQVANAARGALVAVDLARGGMPGVRAPVEGRFGYAALFEGTGGFDLARARLGDGHRIAELSWKPFPTGRAAQGGIVALQEVLAGGVAAADIAEIEYRAPPLIARLVGRTPYVGMPVAHARLCLPWLAAVVLARGTVGLADFTPERLADPALLARAADVTVIDDGNPDPAAFVPAVLVVRRRGGGERRVAVASLLGAPERPLNEAQHLAKARGCLEFVRLGDRAEALAAAIEGLGDAPDALQAIRATGVLG